MAPRDDLEKRALHRDGADGDARRLDVEGRNGFELRFSEFVDFNSIHCQKVDCEQRR